MSSAKRYDPSKKRTTSLTGILLYLLPFPILLAIIISFLSQNPISIIKYSISYGLFFLGAKVAKKGFDFEKRYQNTPLANVKRVPYKTISAIIIAFATLFTSFITLQNSLLFSLILSISSLFGYYLFYGFDPKQEKDLMIGVRAEDLIKITSDAEDRIKALKTLKSDIKEPHIKDDLKTIIDESQTIIDSIKEDPSDLSKARKFLKIYLERTYNITDEFVKNLKKDRVSEDIKNSYKDLLHSMKNTIKEQKEKLNDDDLLSLDIQMEALTKQLNQEGV